MWYVVLTSSLLTVVLSEESPFCVKAREECQGARFLFLRNHVNGILRDKRLNSQVMNEKLHNKQDSGLDTERLNS